MKGYQDEQLMVRIAAYLERAAKKETPSSTLTKTLDPYLTRFEGERKWILAMSLLNVLRVYQHNSQETRSLHTGRFLARVYEWSEQFTAVEWIAFMSVMSPTEPVDREYQPLYVSCLSRAGTTLFLVRQLSLASSVIARAYAMATPSHKHVMRAF